MQNVYAKLAGLSWPRAAGRGSRWYAPRVTASSPPGGEPRVKGVAFRTNELCFFELRGPEARDRARALMEPQLSHAFRHGLVLAASWYPISWYRDAFHAFRTATGEGIELVRAIGKCAVRRDMAGVHKQLIAKVLS